MAGKTHTAAQRSWRERSATSGETPEIRRTKRWFMTFVVLGLLGVFIWQVWHLFSPIPEVRLACLRVVNYDALTVPSVPYADTNANALSELLGDRSITLDSLETTATFSSLAGRLKAFAAEPSSHLILYVNAHGVASGDAPYLLCSDYLRPGAEGRIEIKQLLRQVAEAPAAEKLIIFDCGYLASDARLGVIGNEFASAVAKQVEATGDKHLWVLLGSAAHQVAQPAYATRRSLLVESMIEAIQGAADADEDRIVDLFELAGFVCQRVPEQARSYKLRDETPALIWGGGTGNPVTSERLFPINVVQAETPEPQSGGDAKTKTARRTASSTSGVLAVTASPFPLIAQADAPKATTATPAPNTPAPASSPSATAQGAAAPKQENAAGAAPAGSQAGAAAPADSAKPTSEAIAAPAADPPPAAAPTKPKAKPKPAEKPDPIEQLWEARDRLLKRTAQEPFNPVDVAPHIWREFEELLLYFERRYRFAGPSDRKELQKDLDRVRGSVRGVGQMPDISSTGPLGDVLRRMVAAKEAYLGSEAQRALAQPTSRAAALRKTIQTRNDAIYRARDYVRWHASASLGASDSHSLMGQIVEHLEATQKLTDALTEIATSGGQADPPVEQADELVALQQTMDGQLASLADDRRITAAQIEELLSTALLDGKRRAKLIARLDGLPVPTSPKQLDEPPPIMRTIADPADRWQRSREQCELELRLAALAGEIDSLPSVTSSERSSQTRCRQVALALEKFYRDLPAKLQSTESTDTDPVRQTDRLIRLVDVRDASLVRADANPIPRLVWLPLPKGELQVEPLPKSIVLASKAWTRLPIALRGTSDFNERVTIELNYKTEELEVRSSDPSIGVSPGATSELKLNRDLTRQLALDVRPRSPKPSSYPLSVSVRAADVEVARANIECMLPLDLPNRVDLVISRDVPTQPDPFLAAIAQDHWKLRPYPNRTTAYRWGLRNQSGKPKKVTVELFSIASPQSGAKLISEQGAVFATLRPKRLVATAQPMELPAADSLIAIPFPAAAASPPAEKPKEGESEKPAPPPSTKPPATPIDGTLLLVVHEVEGEAHHWPQLVELSALTPKDYLQPRVRFDKGRITVEMRALAPEFFPPLGPEESIDVQWTFADAAVAALDPAAKRRGKLTAADQVVTLFARVGSGEDKRVGVQLHVDGYPRAFMYDVPCHDDGATVTVDALRDTARIQVRTPAEGFVSTPLEELPVLIEVDAPEDAFQQPEDAVLLGIDMAQDRTWDDEDTQFKFRSDRLTKWSLVSAGPGVIEIAAAVDDYRLELPTEGLENERVDVFAQLLLPRRGAAVDSVADQDNVEVVFDRQEPIVGSIELNPPSVVEIGKKLQVIVEADDGQLSGIDKVLWAFDGNANDELDDAEKETAKAIRYDAEKGYWPMAIDTKEIKEPDPAGHKFFVWAVDKVGNTSLTKSASFKLRAPPEPAALKPAAKKGTIRGTVALEERGGTPQYNLVAVRLKEDKPNGGTIQSTKAGTDGNFEFKGVPIGSYVVEAAGPVIGSNKVGSASVVLEPLPIDPSKPPLETVEVLIGRPKPPMTPPPAK